MGSVQKKKKKKKKGAATARLGKEKDPKKAVEREREREIFAYVYIIYFKGKIERDIGPLLRYFPSHILQKKYYLNILKFFNKH